MINAAGKQRVVALQAIPDRQDLRGDRCRAGCKRFDRRRDSRDAVCWRPIGFRR